MCYLIDIQLIKKNPEKYKYAASQKNIDCDIDALLNSYQLYIKSSSQLQNLQSQRNSLSSQFHQLKTDKTKTKILHQKLTKLKSEIEDLKAKVSKLKSQFNDQMLLIPSLFKEDVPIGASDKDNIELAKSQKHTPSSEDLTPKSHIELIESLNLGNFNQAVKLSGSRSYVLSGAGSIIEQAIMRMSYDLLISRKFTPMTVPVLVNFQCMQGTGYFPGGKDQAYIIEKDHMALIGTSEVSLCSFYQNTVLDPKQLPLKLMAWTSCFRREAGSYGKDTKGLFRVHQFQKIEQVVITNDDHSVSDSIHQQLLKNSIDILELLELPFRVVKVCTGDLGQGQFYKHDIEVWMPSRNSYGESHSCSSFNDFQSRRLNIKYVNNTTNKKHFCYTLNNTAIASPRILIALFEIHQTKDGDIRIPKELQKYCFNKKFISELNSLN